MPASHKLASKTHLVVGLVFGLVHLRQKFPWKANIFQIFWRRQHCKTSMAESEFVDLATTHTRRTRLNGTTYQWVASLSTLIWRSCEGASSRSASRSRTFESKFYSDVIRHAIKRHCCKPSNLTPTQKFHSHCVLQVWHHCHLFCAMTRDSLTLSNL